MKRNVTSWASFSRIGTKPSLRQVRSRLPLLLHAYRQKLKQEAPLILSQISFATLKLWKILLLLNQTAEARQNKSDLTSSSTTTLTAAFVCPSICYTGCDRYDTPSTSAAVTALLFHLLDDSVPATLALKCKLLIDTDLPCTPPLHR
ncbi:uncharacterized protein ACWYII_020564 isoform 1-T1 [Salvelinus alpinus]